MTAYLKTEPKMGSENTSHRSNLYGMEIIIRTSSKVLSEMKEMSKHCKIDLNPSVMRLNM